jgi:hypothetical protein
MRDLQVHRATTRVMELHLPRLRNSANQTRSNHDHLNHAMRNW